MAEKETENINENECTHDCSTCEANCPSKNQESLEFPANEMSNVKKVIAVVSGKGGVGKSLVTSMLAVLSSRNGYTSAILDADITGPSIPKILGAAGQVTGSEQGMFPVSSAGGIKLMSVNLLLENETQPVVWRGPVIAGVVKQFWSDVCWGDVDYMYVDMPPGTGDVPLTVFQSLPVDGIIIVTSPQDLVSMIVEKALNMAKLMKIPVLGLIENYSYLVCPDCKKKISVFGESRAKEAAQKYGIDLLASIPIDPSLAALCDKGKLEFMENNYLDKAFDTIASKLED